MGDGEAIIVDRLGSVETRPARLAAYDREIGLGLLYEDPVSGAEHYLVRYPAGLQARAHRHTAAQTIVVLEGRLAVNDEIIGPGAYCHFPPGEPMFRAPAEGAPCVFVTIFHGPFDLELLDARYARARAGGRTMTFRGWPAEALEFYEGLEADNTKTYWQANKHVYESIVRAPMEELLAELEPEWGEGHIFRPYRDVRFSADKSPYKTHIGAVVGDGYVQLDADGLAAGSGMWEMAPDQLERYRQAVADDRRGGRLAKIVAAAREAGLQVTGHGSLKTAPRGYPKDHPRIELLRCKGLVTWHEWPAGPWLGTRRAKDRVVGFFRLSVPLNRWLHANVGPSTAPPEPRRRR